MRGALEMANIEWTYNDGGREETGYKGTTDDCVTRAIAIATNKNYQTVYDELTEATKVYAETHNNKVAKALREAKAKGRPYTPRNGVYKEVFKPYLKNLGWEWIPTMFIGQGTKVHLKADELPKGNLIVNVSRHITTVLDGVLHDIFDCSREGTRAVYGYFVLTCPQCEESNLNEDKTLCWDCEGQP